MTKEQLNVKDFMTKAGQALPPTPTIPDAEVRLLRAKLILEEATELIVKGLGVGFNMSLDLEWDVWDLGTKMTNLTEIADGCADLTVVTDGCALACGMDLEPIRAEVDRSNASKFIDGHWREDGKWIKGPSYSPANLQPILDAQSKGEKEPLANVQYPG